jgi:CRP/FNR family transcriptional regulator
MSDAVLPIEFAVVPMLRSLPPPALVALARVAQPRDFARGERLLHQGAPCRGPMLLLRGTIELRRRSPQGAERTIAVLGPGEVFGLASLRGGTSSDNHADALTAVRVAAILTEDLIELGERHPVVLAYLARAVAGRMGVACQDAAADAGHLTDRLLRLLRRFETPSPAAPEETAALRALPTGLSHAELARMLGAERASVTRALADLETRGLVTRRHGHVAAVAAGCRWGAGTAPQ